MVVAASPTTVLAARLGGRDPEGARFAGPALVQARPLSVAVCLALRARGPDEAGGLLLQPPVELGAEATP